MSPAGKSTPSGKKNVTTIRGDVVGSVIVTGDNNIVNYFTGEYVSLKEHYIPPDSVFQRVRTEDFIGRDWLTVQVDAFLNDPQRKSGAFLLIGDAGVGKTSFMAHLVKERGYLHLFAEQMPGQAMLQRAIQSLGSQLVTRYQIDPYKDRDTLIQGTVFPDFLERLLRMAAGKLTGGEKIVIVCDALDEAGTFPDGNVFGLPNVLPDGVYLILSQRPVNVKLPNLEPEVVHLEAEGKENLQDMEIYLRAVAKRPEVAGQIQAKEYSEDFFVQTLKEKSLGVWMYLHYVIKEIERGQRAPLDLENLPKGLVGYYSDYWDNWRSGRKGIDSSKWDSLYAPLLATLAAAQQAVAIETLIEWSDVQANSSEAKRLLDESWSAFIVKKEEKGKATYALYHQSLRDFITGKIDTKKLPPTHANLVNDLSKKKVEAHQRIVKIFEMECGGEWEKLVEREYPRLHLSAHLNGAGEYETLRILLTEGDEKIKWAEAREKKEETYAGYLNDLTYVWAYAEREQNYALAIRCMLIENSVHSLAANIPPELLVELGRSGMWSYVRCLEVIKQKTEDTDKADSLELLAPNLPSELLQEALATAQKITDERHRTLVLSILDLRLNDELKVQTPIAREVKDQSARLSTLYLNESGQAQTPSEALNAVREIKEEVLRALMLDDLAPYLIDLTLKAQALAIVREIKNGYIRVRALGSLAPYPNDELQAQAFLEELAAIQEIEDEEVRASALRVIAPHLNDKLRAVAVAVARKIKDEYDRSRALSKLMPYLDDELKVLELVAARRIKDEFTRVKTLCSLVPHLDDGLRSQALSAALGAAREIKSDVARARAFCYPAPYLNGELQAQALFEALAAVQEIKYQSGRANALRDIAPHLNDELQVHALSIVRENKDELGRIDELKTLVPYLNAELQTQALSEALSIVREIKNEDNRAFVLVYIAPHLNDEFKAQALAVALEIKDEHHRVHALAALAPHLNEESKAQALSAAHEIKDEFHRDQTLSVIAQHPTDEMRISILLEMLYLSDNDSFCKALSVWKEIEFEGLKENIIPFAKFISQEGRNQGVKVIGALTPALVHFSGEEIVPELYRAIQDTARWWP
jgi:hypothetical protein